MGLLDSILGAMGGMSSGGQQQQGENPLINIVLGMLANSGQGGAQACAQGAGGAGGLGGMMGGLGGAGGGIGGLLQQFQQAGLGHVLESWIGTGQNHPISGDQLQQVLGHGQIGDIAQKLGVSPQYASGQLAQVLPQIIDMLTPKGQVPQGGFGDAGAMMGMLQGMLKR